MSGVFLDKLQGVVKDAPIILYYVSGARSNTYSMFLAGIGLANITNGISQHHVQKLLS